MINQAKKYAIKCHNETNHKYHIYDYDFHLNMVAATAYKFINLIPEEDRKDVIAACWCHDVIEDCRQTYNDVKRETNEQVAEIVYAVTNEKGKYRKERANKKYYDGIRNTKHAPFVKICDRIANIEYSIISGSNMINKYISEMTDIESLSNDPEYAQMFIYLNLIANQSSNK